MVYSKIPSTKKDGEFQAKNINLDLNKRYIGYIKVEESKFGQEFYYIIKYNSDERYFLHHTNVRRDFCDRFISIDEYAFFNTGLVDKFQNDIYAYFVKNKRYSECQPWGVIIPKWQFREFATDQSKYYKYFNTQADIASYFGETETSKLVFDTYVTIRPNWEHLETRRHRVNSIEIHNMSEQEFRDAIADSIDMAKKRIKRNYKTAIPQYYNEDIQFLVPLCERKNRGKAIAAMVVQKTEQIYVVSTILTLDQAYNNARLLAKPDREWLNP